MQPVAGMWTVRVQDYAELHSRKDVKAGVDEFDHFLIEVTKQVLKQPSLALPRCCTHDGPNCEEKHVHTWERDAPDSSSPESPEYRKYQTRLDSLSNVCRDAALMLDYYLALCQELGVELSKGGLKPTRNTLCVVKDLLKEKTTTNGHGGMHVIRFKLTDTSTEFKKGVLSILQKANRLDLFAVLQNTSNETLNAKQLNDQHESFMERAKSWRNPNGSARTESPFPSQFEDLNQIPCLLMIVGKGRMGDTFPSSLKTWDLRAKYHLNVTRSTFEQDIGRCFGYTDLSDKKQKIREKPDQESGRPMLLLSKRAAQVSSNGAFGMVFVYDVADSKVKKDSGATQPLTATGAPSPTKQSSSETADDRKFINDGDPNAEFDKLDDEDEYAPPGHPAKCDLLDDGNKATGASRHNDPKVARGEIRGVGTKDALVAGKQPIFNKETGEHEQDEQGNFKFTDGVATELFLTLTNRAVIFYAPPQSGKTGAFIHLIQEIQKHNRKSSNPPGHQQDVPAPHKKGGSKSAAPHYRSNAETKEAIKAVTSPKNGGKCKACVALDALDALDHEVNLETATCKECKKSFCDVHAKAHTQSKKGKSHTIVSKS